MKKRFINFMIILTIVALTLGACTKPDPVEDLEDTEMDGTGEEIEIVDMAGETIKLDKVPEKVFATTPIGTIILYSIDPDKIIGWNYDLKEGEKEFILEEYHDLPNLGGAGREAINTEELLKLDPDVIISMGETNEGLIDIGKPVVYLDDSLESLPEVYEILGKVLGEEERAVKLAKYCRETIDYVEEKSSEISEEDRVGVYYAEGPNGLETEPAGSYHGVVLDKVGGKNVAEVSEINNKGKSEVSIEQIISWDPEVIISWDDERGGYYSGILEDEAWGGISAVKNKDVYEIPNKPFNWFDRPPTVNRILGLKWLGNLLYPEIYDYIIEDEVREFYKEFYHYELNDEELNKLLINTIR